MIKVGVDKFLRTAVVIGAILVLACSGSASAAQQVTIAQSPSIGSVNHIEEGQPARFRLTRVGDDSRSLLVRVAVSGAAGFVPDGERFVTIPARVSTVELSIATVNDAVDEPDATTNGGSPPERIFLYHWDSGQRLGASSRQ